MQLPGRLLCKRSPKRLVYRSLPKNFEKADRFLFKLVFIIWLEALELAMAACCQRMDGQEQRIVPFTMVVALRLSKCDYLLGILRFLR